MTEGKSDHPTVTRTQSRGQTSSGLARLRAVARRDKSTRFTNLMHHLSPELLEHSFYELKRHAAAGTDGTTWMEYGRGLATRLADLHDRIHSGRYRAQPSRRVWIPKPGGGKRPLGIASLEDKIVQHATVGILNEIYEADFLGFSYGFRPGRSQHNALDAVAVGIKTQKVNWVVDADIRSFFDTVDHDWLVKFLEHRIADRRMLRLLRKWLKAGVTENGTWTKAMVGTPQGSVISPLLANIYLHYVFDLWVQRWRQTNARGKVIVIRYADDIVVGLECRDDAEAFREHMEERFAQFNLELNQEKTRLIRFGRFAAINRARDGEGKPETFTFLGFTHICGCQKSNGKFMVVRKTMSKRQRAKLKEVKEELRWRREQSIPEQGQWLRRVVQGYFNYHAVPGNSRALSQFRYEVCHLWHRSLRRRSHKARNLNWTRMARLVDKWVPTPRILHPYPEQRLIVTT